EYRLGLEHYRVDRHRRGTALFQRPGGLCPAAVAKPVRDHLGAGVLGPDGEDAQPGPHPLTRSLRCARRFGAGPRRGAAKNRRADKTTQFEHVSPIQSDLALVGLAAFRIVYLAVVPGLTIAGRLHVPQNAQALYRAITQGLVGVVLIKLGLSAA